MAWVRCTPHSQPLWPADELHVCPYTGQGQPVGGREVCCLADRKGGVGSIPSRMGEFLTGALCILSVSVPAATLHHARHIDRYDLS